MSGPTLARRVSLPSREERGADRAQVEAVASSACARPRSPCCRASLRQGRMRVRVRWGQGGGARITGGWRRGGVGRVPGGARGGAEGEGRGRGERWRGAGGAARTVQRRQPRPAGTARRARQAARHGSRGDASSAGAWALTAAVSGRQRSAYAAVGPPLAATTPSAAANHTATAAGAPRGSAGSPTSGDRASRPRRMQRRPSCS